MRSGCKPSLYSFVVVIFLGTLVEDFGFSSFWSNCWGEKLYFTPFRLGCEI
jgi:hypothetical protein